MWGIFYFNIINLYYLISLKQVILIQLINPTNEHKIEYDRIKAQKYLSSKQCRNVCVKKIKANLVYNKRKIGEVQISITFNVSNTAKL